MSDKNSLLSVLYLIKKKTHKITTKILFHFLHCNIHDCKVNYFFFENKAIVRIKQENFYTDQKKIHTQLLIIWCKRLGR